MKKLVLSLLQPTGSPHLGNYLGALQQWTLEQDSSSHTSLFGIATLHALTTRPSAEHLRDSNLETARWLSALLDSRRCILFDQALIPEHAELGWMLQCMSHLGELQRMTQFKDKAAKTDNFSPPTGLLTYPTLMAADIAIYRATHIPVGDDQRQHLELTATILQRFNGSYRPIFPIPQAIHTATPRIMSLKNPLRKMSKSEPEGCIFLADDEASIRRKVRAAVTDSGAGESPGVINLLLLLEATGGQEQAEEFRRLSLEGSLRYSVLKDAVAEQLLHVIEPIRRRYLEVTPDQALRCIRDGSEKARELAQRTIMLVREALGLL